MSAYQKISQTRGIVGAPAYAAPELSSSQHDYKVDVYSFAVCLLEINLRTPVWNSVKTIWEISQRVLKGERPSIPDRCPFTQLIQKSWHSDPSVRPDFKLIFYELLEMQLELKY